MQDIMLRQLAPIRSEQMTYNQGIHISQVYLKRNCDNEMNVISESVTAVILPRICRVYVAVGFIVDRFLNYWRRTGNQNTVSVGISLTELVVVYFHVDATRHYPAGRFHKFLRTQYACFCRLLM